MKLLISFMSKLLDFFRKTALEKKIFLIFFVVTLFFVFILTSIEWQIGAFFIRKYEADQINKQLDKLKKSLGAYKREGSEYIEKVVSNSDLKNALKENDVQKINNIAREEFSGKKYIAIFNLDRERVAGESWDLLDKYLKEIFNRIVDKTSGMFFVNQGDRIYSIYYAPLFSDIENNNLYGFVVSSEEYNIKKLKNLDFVISSIVPDIDYMQTSKLSLQDDTIVKFKNKLNNVLEEKKSEAIIRVSSDKAFGMLIRYDLKDNPAIVFLVRYLRNFNSFARNSALLLLLVIFSIALVILSFLGSWFGNRIISPVKQVSNEMQRITNNPETVSQIEEVYQGELGEMVDIFNKMNLSLSKYRNSLKRFKLVTENLKAGVFWLDKNWEIVFCNNSFLDLFHLNNKEQAIKRSFTEFITLSKEQIERCEQEKVVILNREITINDEKRFVIIITNPLKRVKKTMLVGSISDETKKIRERKAREELEIEMIKMNKLATIGKRVEGVVHNVNSPLNSILGYAQLFKKKMGDNEDVERILIAARKITSYIKTLQAKIRNEEITMVRPINVNELVEQEIEFCKHNLFFKHEVETHTNLQEKLPAVKAVYGDISSCFTNLFNNAIDSLKKSDTKKIWVKTYKKNSYVAIEIKDSGCGIEEKNIDKIFKPEFTTKKEEKGSGLGLGLAICKRIAEKYNGYIDVETKPDVGSTFTFFIPI